MISVARRMVCVRHHGHRALIYGELCPASISIAPQRVFRNASSSMSRTCKRNNKPGTQKNAINVRNREKQENNGRSKIGPSADRHRGSKRFHNPPGRGRSTNIAIISGSYESPSLYRLVDIARSRSYPQKYACVRSLPRLVGLPRATALARPGIHKAK